MGSDVLSATEDKITEAAVAGSSVKRVPAGSVAIVVRSGILERKIPISIVPFETTLNQDMKALLPRSGIDPRWMAWGMRAFEQTMLRDLRKSGTTVASLDTKALFDFKLPLPPLDEQRRIVATLEDHLSRLDAADAALGRVAARSQMLGRSQLNKVLRDNRWAGVKLGDLAMSASYGTSTKCALNGPGKVVVRIPNLVEGAIDLTDRKSAIDPDMDLTKYMLQEGDLLFVRTNGSRDLIGRTAVVGVSVEAAFASYLIRFQLDSTRVRPRWVSLMTQSTAVRRAIESGAASSAGQYNLNLKTLKSLEIPLPPIAIQDEYLDTLADLGEDFTRARWAAESGCNRSSSLRRSLLHAAFTCAL